MLDIATPSHSPGAGADLRSAAVAKACAWAEEEIAFLSRLAEAGTRMAEALARRAEAAADEGREGETPEPGKRAPEKRTDVAFQRVARAVRLTLALRSKISKDMLALIQGEAAAAPSVLARPAGAPQAELSPLDQRRERAHRIVERIITDDEDDLEEAERLSGRAWERLEDEDVYGDLLSRPLGEVVALICEDLELAPDWVKLAREAWAVEEAAGGDARSPFLRPGFLPPEVGEEEGEDGVERDGPS